MYKDFGTELSEKRAFAHIGVDFINLTINLTISMMNFQNSDLYLVLLQNEFYSLLVKILFLGKF